MKSFKFQSTQAISKVGRWHFSFNYGIVKSPKRKVLLMEPRLAKLLYFLSLNVDSYVSRAYLLENIWTDTIVNEESLTRAVSDLRKLLAKHFNGSLSIETMRGRGYSLMLKEESKIDLLKSRLNPNIGYAILGLFCLLVLVLTVGSALGIVETKFIVQNN